MGVVYWEWVWITEKIRLIAMCVAYWEYEWLTGN
jgi:hypothetical protein